MGDYGFRDEVEEIKQELKNDLKEDLDPEYAALFGDTALPSGGFLTSQPLDILRSVYNDIDRQTHEHTPTLGTKESVGTIRMRDGCESEIRIFRPSVLPDNGSPVIVLIFAGGYLVGTNMQMVPFARSLSALYNATTITLSYRLAPEFPSPTAANDVWDSVKWIAQHATLLGADPSKGFVLGGPSAGGNLTCVTAQRAIKEHLSPPLTGLWVSVPVVTVTAEGLPEKYRSDWVSRTLNADAPILSVRDIEASRVAYNPDLFSDDFSPFALPDTVPHMPPAYIQVAGLDPLRDDGLIYERYLQDHGVKTRLDVYPGVPHCHYALHPELESSKKFRRDVPLGVGWLLGQEVKEEEVNRVAAAALGL
ncbi:Alpha/Beta hydrolase protein [Aspergillus cavernicola]|uniref:Alpha/Beta hydrolase protein n=1 Tax=Aspergillus cavernicola TaxID=176166 RepID=A0ABR4HNY8_9EURO